ncbi:hypothetical protein JTE90_025488 [Oedothorax gibbosus]|uniref:Uncharacterized protein n=1 Tax=Oedothorax gibbosus TaxID=931172 RepID=A0AAV6UZQ1_9ARAC|nr:hypothetical protein JTE90_025488 [Oedothorax gibbosus]
MKSIAKFMSKVDARNGKWIYAWAVFSTLIHIPILALMIIQTEMENSTAQTEISGQTSNLTILSNSSPQITRASHPKKKPSAMSTTVRGPSEEKEASENVSTVVGMIKKKGCCSFPHLAYSAPIAYPLVTCLELAQLFLTFASDP